MPTSRFCSGSTPSSIGRGSSRHGCFASDRRSRLFPSTTARAFQTTGRGSRASTWPTPPRFIRRTGARTTASGWVTRSPRSSRVTSLEEPPPIDLSRAMSAAQVPRLEVNDIVSTYVESGQQLTALAELSLSVGRAEFVALVGPSGSGKSTLLDVISGLLSPDSGTVFIDGDTTTAAQRLGQIGRAHA